MTDLHTRAVTLADADGTAPDVIGMHKLAIRCLDTLEAPPPPVMYILRDGNGFQSQDYFAHWGPIPYIRADKLPQPTAAALDALKAAPLSAALAYERAADSMTMLLYNTPSYVIVRDIRDLLAEDIRALPHPTDAELDAAALARPVVRALVEALGAMVGRHTAYCGGPDLPFAGHTDVKIMGIANAALVAAKGSTP